MDTGSHVSTTDDPRPMSTPTCCALACDSVADDKTGLCPDHRRALTLTVKMQDAVSEFLQTKVGNNLQSSVRLNAKNVHNVELAGNHLAHALALLISALFESTVDYDDAPIKSRSLSVGEQTNWSVLFEWMAGRSERFIDWTDAECDDEEDEP